MGEPERSESLRRFGFLVLIANDLTGCVCSRGLFVCIPVFFAEREQVTAESVHDEETEEVPESTTESTVPPFTEEEVTASTPTTAPAGEPPPTSHLSCI